MQIQVPSWAMKLSIFFSFTSQFYFSLLYIISLSHANVGLSLFFYSCSHLLLLTAFSFHVIFISLPFLYFYFFSPNLSRSLFDFQFIFFSHLSLTSYLSISLSFPFHFYSSKLPFSYLFFTSYTYLLLHSICIYLSVSHLSFFYYLSFIYLSTSMCFSLSLK